MYSFLRNHGMNVKTHHFSIKLCVLSWTTVQRKCAIAFLHSQFYTLGGFVTILSVTDHKLVFYASGRWDNLLSFEFIFWVGDEEESGHQHEKWALNMSLERYLKPLARLYPNKILQLVFANKYPDNNVCEWVIIKN